MGVGVKYHICPHCKAHLDIRMSLYEGVHCPSCGKVINWEYDS